MANETEFDPKQRVKELVWEWTQRVIVLAVTFGIGYFSAYWSYAEGQEGAISLRQQIRGCRADVERLKKENDDKQSKLEVVQPRLDECVKNLSKARETPPATPPPAQ